MNHVTTITTRRTRRGQTWEVQCSCGAGVSGLTTAGMASGWIAEHDPHLAALRPLLS